MTAVFNRIGPYEVLKEIGRGGMAAVFLANDTRTSTSVALKLVPRGSDRETREILEAEQLGAELQKQFCRVNPRVPAVYEHGLEGGYFYVAMEYLDGENLSDVIARGPLDVHQAVAFVTELCRFLEDAHSFEVTIGDQKLRSLLHGDLTSRNVRITSGNQVKVLDFGIAKALSLSRKVTRNDFGSRAYLSPERLESGVVDAYADFWALGVLLYEMVRGAPPFQAPDTRRLEERITSRRPPPSLEGLCPVGLQAIISKLLGPNQGERYGEAIAIRQDLERFSSNTPTRAEQEGWPGRAAEEPATRRTRPVTEAGPAVPGSASLDQETTRRASSRTTSQPGAKPGPVGPPPLPPLSPPPLPPLPNVPRVVAKKSRFRSIIRAALLIIAILLVLNEISVATDAGRVANLVPTRDLDGLAAVWSQYDELDQRSVLNIGTMGLRRSLTYQTASLADRVIGNYRTGLSTVRERQWTTARDALARAVAIAPSRDSLRASLRYCEGHVHRINGDARKERKQAASAQEEFGEAIAAFREAAELRPDWPDPFLGLARTFISGLGDVDRGADALNQAQRLGYTPGDREILQLADGYRERGDTLAIQIRRVAGMSQEHDYLMKTVEVYQKALDLYSKIVLVDGVPRKIRLAERGLEHAQRRLDEQFGSPDIHEPQPPDTDVPVEEPSGEAPE